LATKSHLHQEPHRREKSVIVEASNSRLGGVGGQNLAVERAELKADDEGEHKELMAIYVARGLEPALAKQVAEQLMAHDAIGAHARDELGISETLRARPIQAALASAGSFAVGAAMPLLITAMVPAAGLIPLVSGTSLVAPRHWQF
jgi:VIT1/CCC1 family predicted Fe2+/Mn2+ transporter